MTNSKSVISIPYSSPSIEISIEISTESPTGIAAYSLQAFSPTPQIFCYILLSVGYANVNTTFSAFLSPEFKRANASLHSSGGNSLVMTVSKL